MYVHMYVCTDTGPLSAWKKGASHFQPRVFRLTSDLHIHLHPLLSVMMMMMMMGLSAPPSFSPLPRDPDLVSMHVYRSWLLPRLSSHRIFSLLLLHFQHLLFPAWLFFEQFTHLRCKGWEAELVCKAFQTFQSFQNSGKRLQDNPQHSPNPIQACWFPQRGRGGFHPWGALKMLSECLEAEGAFPTDSCFASLISFNGIITRLSVLNYPPSFFFTIKKDAKFIFNKIHIFFLINWDEEVRAGSESLNSLQNFAKQFLILKMKN